MKVGVGLPLIGVEDHRWSAAAVVVELIMIEFGEHFVLEVVQQIRGEQAVQPARRRRNRPAGGSTPGDAP